jgi:hypothetical protein
MQLKRTLKILAGVLLVGIFVVVVWFVIDLMMDDKGVGSRSTACKRALTEVIETVPGVKTVAAECTFNFGYSSQKPTITLDTNDVEVAKITAEQVLKAMAASPKIDDGWRIPSEFKFADGRLVDGLITDIGFNTMSVMATVRVRYGIEPSTAR